MTLQYRGFNFIIFLPDEQVSTGSYFNLTEDQYNLYAIMLKDTNFSLIDKKKHNYDIYLAKGNLYSAIKKIKSGNLNINKICNFNTDNYKKLFNDNISIKFAEHFIDKGIYLSNPIITINKNYLNNFIDNL